MSHSANSDCAIEPIDQKNNGLITKIWGGPGWIFGHSITFGYPLNPTEEQKNAYKQYFISLGDVLPCRYCRESYKKFISVGNTELTNEVMKNRESLTRWFYRVHEAVNAKLGVDYGITYEDVMNKYESFRAKCGKPNRTKIGCIAPLDYKAFSFKKLYDTDAPIISLHIAIIFTRIAYIRKMDKKYFAFIELAIYLDGNFSKLKKQECWRYRNIFCDKLIKHMRKNSIPSLEEDGIWKGMPTLDELKLIMFLSSNLNKFELSDTIEKIHSMSLN